MNVDIQALLAPIYAFLQCETPDEWVHEAAKPQNLGVLLCDHLVCELKAAQSAMFLLRRYAVDESSGKALLVWLKPFEDFTYRQQGDWRQLEKLKLSKTMIAKSSGFYKTDLVDKMVLLIREELHHFYQVLEIMQAYGVTYKNINSSRYAKGLLRHVKTHEPDALIDKLICGAYIEARSCERFAKIAPHLDKPIADFYLSLLRSEARHYQDYLSLARAVAEKNVSDKDVTDKDIATRIAFFGEVEAELIQSPDSDFKFHSGLPMSDITHQVAIA